jgi:hypothetical protein
MNNYLVECKKGVSLSKLKDRNHDIRERVNRFYKLVG